MKGCRNLTVEQRALMAENMKGKFAVRNKALFIFGCNTGYRITALLSLKIKHVWLHDQPVTSVYVAKKYRKMGKSKGKIVCPECGHNAPIPAKHNGKCPDCDAVVKIIKPKKAEGREVPLNNIAKQAVEDLINHHKERGTYNPDTYLFLSRKGGVPISRSSAWRIISEAAWHSRITGKVGTHSMRKTFGQDIFEALDRDLLKTKQALGHQSIDSTIQYLHQDAEEINSAILNLNREV